LAATQDPDKIAGRVFNIGTGTSTSVNDLARLVGSTFGTGETPKTYKSARAGEIRYSRASNDEARTKLHWQSTSTIGESLSLIWRDFGIRP